MLSKLKIKSKKSIGVQPVYDLNVIGPHHYILENGVVSHNSGFIYASSIVVAMRTLKLKEDKDGNKISAVTGIRAACKVMKTRYSKPFETVQIKIPYDSGMNPFSGLFDMFEAKGLFSKSGNSYIYIDPNSGEELKMFKKKWEANVDNCLDLIMENIMAGKHNINNQ